MASLPGLDGVQKKVIRFFRDHPNAVETLRGLGTWVGVEEEKVREAVKRLLGRKWLEADETSAVTGYALTRDARLLAEMKEAIEPE